MVTMSAQRKEDESTEAWKPSWQLKCIFAVVGLLNFVAALDATSLSVALPVYFHPNPPSMFSSESLSYFFLPIVG
jgi:hypothetical protein